MTSRYRAQVSFEILLQYKVIVALFKNIIQHTIGKLELTPKGLEAIFQAFLKFGQAIVDAIFVQKNLNFWWICSLVVASRCTNFYKITIFGLGAMPQKQKSFVIGQLGQPKKLFIF